MTPWSEAASSHLLLLLPSFIAIATSAFAYTPPLIALLAPYRVIVEEKMAGTNGNEAAPEQSPQRPSNVAQAVLGIQALSQGSPSIESGAAGALETVKHRRKLNNRMKKLPDDTPGKPWGVHTREKKLEKAHKTYGIRQVSVWAILAYVWLQVVMKC